MINPEYFRDHIVIPALDAIGGYSKAAERLLVGTALTESGLQIRRITTTGSFNSGDITIRAR